MGRGILEGSPRVEQIQLDTKTSDPSNPAKGQMWIRTDLTGTDKVGELKWYDGGSINSVDIVTPGTTVNTVEEVLRVQTPNGKGVIKTAPVSSATHPQIRFPHGGSNLGLGHTVNTTPSSGVYRFTMDDDDITGDSLADVWNGNDATIYNTISTVTGANQTYSTGQALDFYENDYIKVPGTGTYDSFSVAVWITLRNVPPNYNRIQLWFVDGTDGGSIAWRALDTGIIEVGGDALGGHLGFDASGWSSGQWHHIVLTQDRSTDTRKVYVDGTEKKTRTDASMSNIDTSTVQISRNDDTSDYWRGKQDDFRFYSKALTSSEVSNLYSNGSI